VAANPEDGAIRYYVQLVRCTDSEVPPQVGSKRVGPKLAETFSEVLRWKAYWEICRRETEVVPGQTSKVRLNDGRSVEIGIGAHGKRTIAAFQNGKLVDRLVVPRGEAMTLIGRDRDPKSAWFIVVRRDKPKE
jgi:hypothetical protein